LVLSRFSSNVESLRKGIIKTSKNKANKPYTILLVGETGVGKSSFLELIANVLFGNDVDHYDFNVVDHSSKQDGHGHQSQTNSARFYDFDILEDSKGPTNSIHVYEVTSKNGIVVSDSVYERGE
jgi:predicted GTPase